MNQTFIEGGRLLVGGDLCETTLQITNREITAVGPAGGR